MQPEEPTGALVADFFQYKLLLDFVDSLGPDAKHITVGSDDQGINRISVSIRRRMLPPRAVQVPGQMVLEWLKPNRLSGLSAERDLWKSRTLWLPKGASLRLDKQVVNSLPQRTLTIVAPGFVLASIQVECRGSGRGILPPAVTVDKASVEHYSTYGIVVTTRARFEWLAAASPDMPAYKQWIKFVFNRLKQLNSDSVSP